MAMADDIEGRYLLLAAEDAARCIADLLVLAKQAPAQRDKARMGSIAAGLERAAQHALGKAVVFAAPEVDTTGTFGNEKKPKAEAPAEVMPEPVPAQEALARRFTLDGADATMVAGNVGYDMAAPAPRVEQSPVAFNDKPLTAKDQGERIAQWQKTSRLSEALINGLSWDWRSFVSLRESFVRVPEMALAVEIAQLVDEQIVDATIADFIDEEGGASTRGSVNSADIALRENLRFRVRRDSPAPYLPALRVS